MRIKKHTMVSAAIVKGISLMLLGYCAVAEAEPQEEHGQQRPVVSQPVREGAVTEGFRLSINTRKNRYMLGEPIDLTVRFRNVNREDVVVHTEGFTLGYALEVIRPDGTQAPLTELGKRMLAGARRRPRTGSATMTRHTRVDFEMGTTGIFDMTQIGEYRLRVSRKVPSIADPKKEVTIYSNMEKIRIEAPQDEG
jgi:hypothetical protein